MRTRQHLNPLGLGFETFRGVVPAIGNDVVVECEIGCADAQFLFERAALFPDRFYVGVEIRELLVDDVNARAAEAGLPIAAVFGNANLHLEKIFAPNRLAAVYVNFPDPWFKRRHEKRRMVEPGLAAQIERALAVGGEIFVQTDVWDIALDALALFEGSAWLENAAGPWSFWKEPNPFGAASWRERNAEASGLPVWRILYRKR